MSSLLDLLNANNGNSLAKHFAGQHAIEQSDAQKAIEALLPAFSNGLKRNSQTPQGFGDLMEALAGGNHKRYSNEPELVSSDEGILEGNKILGHLFKSKDLSRNIAASASKNTGVSVSLIKQMLPALAPIILGALTNNMQNNTPTQNASAQYASGGGANPLGRILEELMKNGMKGGGRSSGNNPLGDILEQVLKNKGLPGGLGDSLGGGLGDLLSGKKSPRSDTKRDTRQETRDERLGNIFGEMLSGKTGEPQISETDNLRDLDKSLFPNENESSYEDDLTDYNAPHNGGLEDLFGDMLRPSQNERNEYDDEVDSIFDEFLGPQR
ncbi:MAG: DUF937 domain-containing protein [Nitratireductor sp.]